MKNLPFQFVHSLAMLNCLRQLSTQSSVMTTPERLPEEALNATMTDIGLLKVEDKGDGLPNDVEMDDLWSM